MRRSFSQGTDLTAVSVFFHAENLYMIRQSENINMEFFEIKADFFEELKELQKTYKIEIGEAVPTEAEFASLRTAIEQELIHFYGCVCDNTLAACCSICLTFSTFNYEKSGIFEDFYIRPQYRHKGIARKLVSYAYEHSNVSSLLVGCADCDIKMYQAIGFDIPLGNMLAYGK